MSDVPRKHGRATVALCCSLVLACSGLAGCSGQTAPTAATAQADGYKHVSAEEAQRIFEAGECTVVDVRSDVDYDMGHLPGAVLVPYDTVDSPRTAELLPDKDALLLVYCDFGGLSKKAAKRLAELGYTNVVEFDGMEVWNGPVEAVEE